MSRLITYTVDAYLTSATTSLWLNTSYPYRRQLHIKGPATRTYPILPPLGIDRLVSLGKVRSDHQDLVVAYRNSDNSWTVLGSVIQNNIIEFAVQNDVRQNQMDDNYYLYYGNLTLTNPLVAPAYAVNPWPKVAVYSDPQVTQTHPDIDWVKGTASNPAAKMTYKFTGTQLKLIADKSYNYGQLHIQIDDSSLSVVDLYSPVTQLGAEVYTISGLSNTIHTVRIHPTGKKSPNSTSVSINVKEFQTRPFIQVDDLGEQDFLSWGRG